MNEFWIKRNNKMPICKRCGYEWKYEGVNIFDYCYLCNKKLSKDRKLKELREELRNNPQKFIEAFKKEYIELINKEISDKSLEDED